MLIWRKDAAKLCRDAAEIVEDVAVNEGTNKIALGLRQLATSLDHGGPVGGVAEAENDIARALRERPPPPGAPVNEYERVHEELAAKGLILVRHGGDGGHALHAVRHIVDAAAHRVMAQVIGAIDKVKATRPTVEEEIHEFRRAVARGEVAPARKPKNGRRRRKAARR